MDRIYDCYIKLYLEELSNLEAGYTYNKNNICYLRKLTSIIYYLENADLTNRELTDIIETIIW